MARALVTGGGGFIGSNLAIALEALGHSVVVLDSRIRPENLDGFQGERITADVTSEIPWDGALDVVFHQAAITDPRHADDSETETSNLEGFRRMRELCLRKGAKLVYASTAGLYGNGPVPMREDQPKETLTAYGRSKLRMDEWAIEKRNELPAVGLRYFNVFGPREAGKGRPASMIYHLGKQMRSGQRPRLFRDGTQRRDHIYVKDVVRANLLALEAPSGVYNVGTGIGTSFNDLVGALNRVLGLALAPEYIDMPFDSRTYQHNTVADTRLAEARMGFKAQWTLEDAIADYFAGPYCA